MRDPKCLRGVVSCRGLLEATMKWITCLLLLLASMVSFAGEAPSGPPLKVVMFAGSVEYDSKDSLEGLAKLLEKRFYCQCVVNVVEEKGTKLNGIEGLETADVAIFFTRRVSLSDDQLAKVKKFIASGKGVV